MIVLISDYDGTFSGKGIDRDNNIKAVNRFRELGNKFLVCTGRGPYKISKEIDFDVDGVITGGGSLIQINGTTEMQVINNDIIKELNEYLLSLGPVIFTNNTIDNKCYLTENEEFRKKGLQRYGETSPKPLDKDVISISIMFENIEKATSLKNIIDDRFKGYLNVTQNEKYLDITSKGVSKESACKRVKEMFPNANITTIGDNLNDLDMLLSFNGACVKSGSNEVINKINKVVDSVADYIDQLLLNK